MDSGTPARQLALKCLCGIAFCLAALSSEAAHPLRIDIDATSFQSRTNGPIPLRLVIHSDNPQIVKGALRIDFGTDTRHLATYTLQSLVLTPGKQETTVLISPFSLERFDNEANVQFTFIGPDSSITQDPTLLRLPGAGKRTFLVGTVLSAVRRQRESPDSRWLDFKTFAPASRNRGAEPDLVQNLLSSIDPDRFPADPNLLTPYDLICVLGQDLGALDEAQTSALLAWVDAGGAVLVQVDETTTLRNHHLDLLNGLSGRRGASREIPGPEVKPLFVVNSNGRLQRDEDSPKFEEHHFSCGWGRAGVLVGPIPSPEDVEADEGLRRLLAWVWRLSSDDRSQFVETTRIPKMSRAESEQILAGAYAARVPWTIPTEFLFPPSIRPVPGWLLATILAVFVVLIGPGDWLILGAIRRHRWTWILLPLLTLGVTRLVIATSNHYLGLSSRLSTIEIRDLGPGNRVARTNRLDFHVPAERGLFELTSTSGQITPFTTQSDDYLRANARRMATNPYRAAVSNPLSVTPDITVNRSSRKLIAPVERWTPVLFRSMAIHPLEAARAPAPAVPPSSGFDWDKAGELLREPDTGGLPTPLIDSLRRSYGPGAVIECFSRRAEVFSQGGDNPEINRFRGRTLGGLIPRSVILRRHFEESAPSGSPSFEDLELQEDNRSEGSRDGTFVLQVIVRESDRVVIYRRRYAKDELFGPDTAPSQAPSI